MPPLSRGDEAECDSNFLCNAHVSGQTERTDATHAVVTVTQIKMRLQLDVTIWLPVNATSHQAEHEEGHSQISQSYYQIAGRIAQQVAAAHVGNQIEISGTDLDAEATKALQQVGNDITAEFSSQLNTEPAQLDFDAITDHGRNAVVVKDAVASALQNNPR